ncbi:MAG: SAM-dependent methyltransferase [Candidatus Thorarchaeota archaeon]
MSETSQYIAFIIILLGFIILLSISLPNRVGAPFVPTRMKKVRKMLEMAKIQPGDTVYDLGCGDGRVIVMAARKFGAKAVGIEIDPFRFLWCQFLITILGLRKKVKVKFGDFFKKDLSNAEVVFCYLLQSTNDRLEEKLIQELSSTARIITHTFIFVSLPLIDEDIDSRIYVYMKGEV